MVVSVRHILDFPELRVGQPQVVAGAEHLDNPVRWVHVSELPDIASLLQGGELILTTGIALPLGASELTAYVRDLAAASVSGLVIELGRRYQRPPEALVRAAEQHAVPLIVLRNEVQFVRITEAVHSVIVDEQTHLLQDTASVHRIFTELSVEGAPPDRIIDRMNELTGRTVVLENLAHQILGYAPAAAVAGGLLRDWEDRSRLVRMRERIEVVEMGERWLAGEIAARGERWGRVFLNLQGPEATSLEWTVLERGAAAVALARLMEHEQVSHELRAHGELIDDIAAGAYRSTEEVLLRADVLGVPLRGRLLLGARVRIPRAENGGGAAEVRRAAEGLSAAVTASGGVALVGAGAGDDLRVILALPRGCDPRESLTRLALTLRSELAGSRQPKPPLIAVGSAVEDLGGLRRSLAEAYQVSRAAPGLRAGRLYYELSDIRLRGLLHLLANDPRLQMFVEHELAPLLEHDARHGTDLIRTLRGFLAAGRNKSLVADELGMSRPAVYQRLQRIERILEIDLDDVEACLGLHVALVSLDVIRAQAQAVDRADG